MADNVYPTTYVNKEGSPNTFTTPTAPDTYPANKTSFAAGETETVTEGAPIIFVRGRRGSGTGLAAPVLAWTTASSDTTPDFTVDFADILVVGDSITLQLASDLNFTSIVQTVTDTLDSTELAASIVTETLTALSNGTYYARAKITHSGVDSPWSNVVTVTISSTPTATTATFLASNSSTTDASSYTFAGISLGDAADLVVCIGTRAATIPSISSVKVHCPNVATDPTGTPLSQVMAPAINGAGPATLAAMWAGARPSGQSTGDLIITFSGTVLRCFEAHYKKTAHTGSSVTGSSVALDPTATLTVPANGTVIGIGVTAQDSRSTPTNLTEDVDLGVEALLGCTTGSSNTASGSTAFTFDFATPSASAGVFAAWGP